MNPDLDAERAAAIDYPTPSPTTTVNSLVDEIVAITMDIQRLTAQRHRLRTELLALCCPSTRSN